MLTFSSKGKRAMIPHQTRPSHARLDHRSVLPYVALSICDLKFLCNKQTLTRKSLKKNSALAVSAKPTSVPERNPLK